MGDNSQIGAISKHQFLKVNPHQSFLLYMVIPQPQPSTLKDSPKLFRVVTFFLVFQIVNFTLNSHTALKVLVQVTTLLCCVR